ncbi:helix-turn-helix transcriptional regulator [Propioniciclava coleopterorum]|uniref:Helix-turn-helix transcriptional regulator n=1 Tax=Propioniciclava coleopterorum TaxID=2714937 RepID=A0A6G7Y9M5_9ACTN|nr:AraC family transcriptional regulator [Propioniciclava coleopterorum]QIK73594.1 helix-turn-helix transcriptional regulator [Propioniciclava coleopterorum]
MQSVTPVADRLRGLVESCVAFDVATDPDATHHGLPSPAATVIAAFGDPLDCGWPDGGQRGRWRLLVAGLHRGPALVHTHGRVRGVQVALTPLGVRALFGVPIGALAGVIVEAEDLPRGPAAAPLDALARLPRWAQPAAVQAWLLGALGQPAAPAPELVEAWRRIRRDAGDARIEGLAEHVGWSRRRLTRRFTAEFGVSPKQAAGIVRFDRARRLSAQGVGLAEASARAGTPTSPT